MNGFLGLFSSLYPVSWFALIPLGGVLLYFYRRKGMMPTRIIPSLLLFSSPQHTAVQHKKIYLPWRLLIDSLLSLLLLSGAAGLIWKGAGKKVAIVLDNSFSMSAVGKEGGTIFQQAQLTAVDLANELLPPSTSIAFITSPTLRKLNSSNDFTGENWAYARDNLEENIRTILSDGTYDELLVVTDREGLKLDDRVTIYTQEGSKEKGNIWIQDASFVDEGKSVEVSLGKSVIDQPSSGVIEVDKVQRANDKLSYIPIAKSDTSDSTLKIPINEKVSSQDPLRIRYIPDIRKKVEDSISADDVAWLGRGSGSRVVELVSPKSSEMLGLNKIPFLQFRKFNNGEALSNVIGSLYAGACPSEWPSRPTLVLSPPPSGCKLFDSKELRGNAEIARWDSAHPITRYVKFPSIGINPGTLIFNSPQLHPVVFSPEGAIVLAGSIDSYRRLLIGFELLPFERDKSLTLSILTLNALQWVFDISASNGSIKPYDAIQLAPGARARDIIHENVIIDSRHQYLTEPGLVEVQSDESNKVIGVNYFDSEESQGGRPIAIEPGMRHTISSHSSIGSTYTILAILALVFLALEVFLARRFRWT